MGASVVARCPLVAGGGFHSGARKIHWENKRVADGAPVFPEAPVPSRSEQVMAGHSTPKPLKFIGKAMIPRCRFLRGHLRINAKTLPATGSTAHTCTTGNPQFVSSDPAALISLRLIWKHHLSICPAALVSSRSSGARLALHRLAGGPGGWELSKCSKCSKYSKWSQPAGGPAIPPQKVYRGALAGGGGHG